MKILHDEKIGAYDNFCKMLSNCRKYPVDEKIIIECLGLPLSNKIKIPKKYRIKKEWKFISDNINNNSITLYNYLNNFNFLFSLMIKLYDNNISYKTIFSNNIISDIGEFINTKTTTNISLRGWDNDYIVIHSGDTYTIKLLMLYLARFHRDKESEVYAKYEELIGKKLENEKSDDIIFDNLSYYINYQRYTDIKLENDSKSILNAIHKIKQIRTKEYRKFRAFCNILDGVNFNKIFVKLFYDCVNINNDGRAIVKINRYIDFDEENVFVKNNFKHLLRNFKFLSINVENNFVVSVWNDENRYYDVNTDMDTIVKIMVYFALSYQQLNCDL